MTAEVLIRAEGLGKKYVIGHQAERERYIALRDVIGRTARHFARTAGDLLRGRAMIAGDSTEDFWALKDVSFEVGRGEVLGIIGRNGAGKSTLLKILSRITEPSEGRVHIRGRVASLLEVGTGFHPELTGRENVYLNGAILGMTRAEVRRKFDEIVAFAEVEQFLDTPVKRYSSGMYVRLAFAVAAHLEPEILIVDEVLAVGDAEFQRKCIGKMQDVTGEGRTVLFVSHNIAAVRALCNQILFLNHGLLCCFGEKNLCIDAYMSAEPREGQKIRFNRASLTPHFETIKLERSDYEYGDVLSLKVTLDSPYTASVAIEVEIHDSNGVPIAYMSTAPMFGKSFNLTPNRQKEAMLKIGPLPLGVGEYSLHLWLIKPWTECYHRVDRAANFRIVHSDPGGCGFDFRQDYRRGSVVIPFSSTD